MLDLSKYQSIGEALRDALDQYPNEVCLIEADREREKECLTYRDFKDRAHPLSKALQDGGFSASSRASIIMTNQSKWLISAYAILVAGGVLVPLDYKLTSDEQWQLLKHSGATVLVTEYPIWRQLSTSPGRAVATNVRTVLVSEAPASADLAGAQRWEEFRGAGEPVFIARKRADTACIVYSSGTGGRPKGCMMTHENYLEQCLPFPSLYPVWPGARYLSILPTNHAIDFMLGFFYQFVSGGLEAILVGGAFTEPQVLQFFYDLGIPVANAYGLTETCVGITANDLKPFRADTVGKPLPGMEVRIVNPAPDGVGEVSVRSKTVMAGYLNEPELTAETIVDGWLLTGDLGRFDGAGHLQLTGRKKNMIVTEEGKNIYPEDIETVFESLPVKEFCVFATNYIWPKRSMVGEKLVLALHLEPGRPYSEELRQDINACNNRLINYKRIHGVVLLEEDFPRTASLKIKRNVLAERLAKLDSVAAILPL